MSETPTDPACCSKKPSQFVLRDEVTLLAGPQSPPTGGRASVPLAPGLHRYRADRHETLNLSTTRAQGGHKVGAGRGWLLHELQGSEIPPPVAIWSPGVGWGRIRGASAVSCLPEFMPCSRSFRPQLPYPLSGNNNPLSGNNKRADAQVGGEQTHKLPRAFSTHLARCDKY